jgi:hypothetical protein
MGRTRLSICVLLLLTIAVGALAETRPSPAQSAEPALKLTASSGAPGDSIVANGSNLSRSDYGILTWLPSDDLVTKIKTRRDGGFRRRFTIPDVPGGDYIILAQVRDQTADATLHVDALSPATDTPAVPPMSTLVPTHTVAPTATDTVVPLPTKSATVDPPSTATAKRSATPNAQSASDAVVLAAGDIASCNGSGDEATAKLLDGLKGTVATLGDNVYDNGTATEFANCYDPSWGRQKVRTKPAPGNHDYNTPGAKGYYGSFGAAAGLSTAGYYSYDLGAWHVIVLNSNISMADGSTQEKWLTSDLNAHPADCTLAYWHHPRYSSGSTHGSDSMSQAIWQDLYDAGAEIVLVGHEHNYERFAPMDTSGSADKATGIREFVVGTGGRSHYPFGTILATSEVRNADTFGVLQLTLHDSSYDWKFIPVAGSTFTDSGSGTCH